MTKISEKQVKSEVKKILKKYKVAHFMPAGSIYGSAGITDFVCCVNGYYLGIETKAPSKGEKGLTALQARHRDDVRNSNGMWLLVYDEATLNALEDLIKLTIENEKAI